MNGGLNDRYYFGNHYVGKQFDLDEIERIVLESKENFDKWALKSKDLTDKKDREKFFKELEKPGTKCVEATLEGKSYEIDWQRESIVFPFLPKKHIQSFSVNSTMFMSKKIPLLIITNVKDHD